MLKEFGDLLFSGQRGRFSPIQLITTTIAAHGTWGCPWKGSGSYSRPRMVQQLNCSLSGTAKGDHFTSLLTCNCQLVSRLSSRCWSLLLLSVFWWPKNGLRAGSVKPPYICPAFKDFSSGPSFHVVNYYLMSAWWLLWRRPSSWKAGWKYFK